MLIDLQNLCSDNQDLGTLSTTPVVSTNGIDLGVAGTPAIGGSLLKDIGRGKSLRAWCQVTTTFTSGGSATMTASLIMADNAALTSNVVTLIASQAIAVATLVAGYQFRLGAVPPGVTKRYLGFSYVAATADMTAGKVSAGLVLETQQNPSV